MLWQQQLKSCVVIAHQSFLDVLTYLLFQSEMKISFDPTRQRICYKHLQQHSERMFTVNIFLPVVWRAVSKIIMT